MPNVARTIDWMFFHCKRPFTMSSAPATLNPVEPEEAELELELKLDAAGLAAPPRPAAAAEAAAVDGLLPVDKRADADAIAGRRIADCGAPCAEEDGAPPATGVRPPA